MLFESLKKALDELPVETPSWTAESFVLTKMRKPIQSASFQTIAADILRIRSVTGKIG
jgi:hypothetical protein